MPFRSITGHRQLLELIARASIRGTLPPSLIFAGPEGVGKRMAAVALAQLVNCLAPVEMPGAAKDSCGECGACKRIARGVHADVLLIEPGENGSIKVDQVRDAIERTAYRPFEGRRRVVIIDGADALNAQAQNSLLKTLEEPAAASSFVLVTSRPDVLLPTVRSRCQSPPVRTAGAGRRRGGADARAPVHRGGRARRRGALGRQHRSGDRGWNGGVRGCARGGGGAARARRHVGRSAPAPGRRESAGRDRRRPQRSRGSGAPAARAVVDSA